MAVRVLLTLFAVMLLGGGFYFFSGAATTSVLAEASCDGFDIELKERYGRGIDGESVDRYFWYETGGSFFSKGKEIMSSVDFPSIHAPDHFQWFEPSTDHEKTKPDYGTLNLTLYAAANDMPASMTSLKGDASRGYRGFGYFSLDEYEKVKSCVIANKKLFESKLFSWYQNPQTGEGHKIPMKIASIAYIPMYPSKSNTVSSKSWEPQIPEFTCPDTSKIRVEGDRFIILEPSGFDIGRIDERGSFAARIRVTNPEWVARAQNGLANINTCVDQNGLSIEEFYTKWRQKHSSSFVPPS